MVAQWGSNVPRVFTALQPVPNSEIDSLLDPTLSTSERDIMRAALLQAPPRFRRDLVYLDANGVFHATSAAKAAKAAQPVPGPRLESDAAASDIEPPDSSDVATAATCPKRTFPRPGGAFWRVYVGCTGYNSSMLEFDTALIGTGEPGQSTCTLSLYQAAKNNSPYVLNGTVSDSGGGSIDAGLQYSNATGKGNWEPFLFYDGTNHATSPNFPCTEGYEEVMQIAQGAGNNNTIFLVTAAFDAQGRIVGQHTDMVSVPATEFPTNGSNYEIRRLTSIGQTVTNFSSGEYFGFPNIGTKPNTANLTLEYTFFAVTGASGSAAVTPGVGYSQSYPVDNTKMFTAPGNNVASSAFNRYEGIYLHP